MYVKLAYHNKYSVSTVDTDGLVLKHQAISSHSAEYAPVRYNAVITPMCLIKYSSTLYKFQKWWNFLISWKQNCTFPV